MFGVSNGISLIRFSEREKVIFRKKILSLNPRTTKESLLGFKPLNPQLFNYAGLKSYLNLIVSLSGLKFLTN